MVNRDMRLRVEREVRAARSRGKAFAAGPVVARIHPNASDPPVNRYAVVAGKKIGKAHERNRCKRLIREAVRLLDPDLVRGYDVVFIVRGGVDELTGFDVADSALRQLFGRAGMLSAPRSAGSETDSAPIPEAASEN